MQSCCQRLAKERKKYIKDNSTNKTTASNFYCNPLRLHLCFEKVALLVELAFRTFLKMWQSFEDFMKV